MSSSEYEKEADHEFYVVDDHMKALELYCKALECSSTPRVHIRHGIVDCLLALRKWQEALNFLEQTLTLWPENFSGLYRKINVLLCLGRIEDCLPVLENMKSTLHPNNIGNKIEFLARSSQVMAHLGEKEKAYQQNQEALKLVDRLTGFRTEWKMFLLTDSCGLLNELGKYRETLSICSQILDSNLKTYWSSAKISKAEALYYLCVYQEALDVLNSEMDPLHLSSVAVLRGVIYASLGQPEEALKQFSISEAEIKDGKQSHFTKRFFYVYGGRIHHLLKNYKRALEFYNLATAIRKEYRLLSKWKKECEDEISKRK